MPFCTNCGASVDGRFCAQCGTPVGGGAPPPDPASRVNVAGLSDNAAGALCYVLGFITGILFLVLEPYNRNRTVRFHAFQSIFLSAAYIVVNLALGATGLFFVLPAVHVAFFILWVYLLVVTFQGKKIALPGIGPLAEQQAART